jgi:biopolymer transport protein ExbD
MKLNLRPRTQPEVNLTSLIDVVLLLLIFFMVSTSFVKQSQIAISLPQADSSAVVEEIPEQIDIMITDTGMFLVNGRELINSRVETIFRRQQYLAADDQRGCQCQTPGRCNGDGCCRTARFHAHQHCDGQRSRVAVTL